VTCTATALDDGEALGVSTAVVGDAVALGTAVVGAAVGASVGATVGGAVGAIVGGAVRTGVGDAVGAGVGGAVAAARTMIVPCIDAPWIPQIYENVPATVNWSDPLCPCVNTAVARSLNFALCDAASRFVHVTVSPTVIVGLLGAKAKFWIVTALVAANATSGSASNPHATISVAAHATAARLTAIPYASCRLASPLTCHSQRWRATPNA